mgnify:CR=1 FL=1|jgi:hypothetical protein
MLVIIIIMVYIIQITQHLINNHSIPYLVALFSLVTQTLQIIH